MFNTPFPMHLKSLAFYLLFLYDVQYVQSQRMQNHLLPLVQDSSSDPSSVNGVVIGHQPSKRSDNETNLHPVGDTVPAQQTSIKKDLPKQEVKSAEHPENSVTPDEVNVKPASTSTTNDTTSIEDANQMKPGTVKRGIIVFGSLTFLFIGYMAYKIWRKSVDSSKDNYLSETQIFKYGVLKSDDHAENLELARMPLTVDSEDDDDDDDLEIFDLEQNRRLHNSKDGYSNLGKSDIQILDLDLPNQNKNEEKNFVLLDLNNDNPVSSSSNDRASFA